MVVGGGLACLSHGNLEVELPHGDVPVVADAQTACSSDDQDGDPEVDEVAAEFLGGHGGLLELREDMKGQAPWNQPGTHPYAMGPG